MSERNQLLCQLQTFHLGTEELTHNHTYHQLISQNESLQKQLEEEKRNCFGRHLNGFLESNFCTYILLHFPELQTESMRLREEKNVIRTVYSNIKDEISKVQKLEENFVDANIEAKRLAVEF